MSKNSSSAKRGLKHAPDGHRKAMVEHTLNVLLLPGIHCNSHRAHNTNDQLISTADSPPSQSPHPSSPSLHVPGTALTIPSPLHFQLHVITRLSFNEQGRVTHHRDYWGVKDVIGLVPGLSLAQWIGTRLAAKGVSYLSKLFIHDKSEETPSTPTADDLETGMASTPSYITPIKTLGLESV